MAVNVPPVQVVEALGVAATTTVAGKLSVKAKLVAGAPFAELLMVKVSVDGRPTPIGLGAKALVKVGGVCAKAFVLRVPIAPNSKSSTKTALRQRFFRHKHIVARSSAPAR